MSEYGLGRIHAPDNRDKTFMMAAAQPSLRTSRYWAGYRHWLDQGQTSQCVAFSWSHFLVDSPTPHALDLDPGTLYHEAQNVDEWPGENYEGTSVRAGAKVLQTEGRIGEYQWAFDLATVVYHLLEIGPVIVGTNWYENMFYPVSIPGTNAYKISIGGSVVGGHAYKLDGINLNTGLVRMKNSWGQRWGYRRFARISLEDLERLISEDGEACRAVEIAV
jgi:hypothetical protein